MVNYLPYLGYLASVFLVIALAVNNDLKFRWFNTMGNICFIIYAILLSSFPVLLTNSILLILNIYSLIRIYNRSELFDKLEFNGDEKLAHKFIEFYRTDIKNYFPAFRENSIMGNLNFVVTRNVNIANMFSADLSADGDAYVQLNYTVEKYRDYKVGRYIFEEEKKYLLDKGVRRIIYDIPVNKDHSRFLQVMGFSSEVINNRTFFTKSLV
jgi:hypothetical protein